MATSSRPAESSEAQSAALLAQQSEAQPAALSAAHVDALAGIALANVATEYPFHLLHLARTDADIVPPRRLHPAFHGSYDWHSCVHMHWSLARCLRLQPDGALATAIAAQLDARLTAANLAGECAYFAAPGRASFERPYGWGWLLRLQAELDGLLADSSPTSSATPSGARSIATSASPAAAQRWRDAVAPLATQLAERFVAWLPRAEYPVRAGTHGNSAFALTLAWRYAQHTAHDALAATIRQSAQQWFGADQRYPANFEPGGDDFLSGGLCEAVLMRQILDDAAWPDWWAAFAPPDTALAHWLTPTRVADASDPKIVHLHGLNLSRAWCWRQLLPRLPAPLQPSVQQAISAHLRTSLAAATSGDYVGTHWLASFALLALSGD